MGTMTMSTNSYKDDKETFFWTIVDVNTSLLQQGYMVAEYFGRA